MLDRTLVIPGNHDVHIPGIRSWCWDPNPARAGLERGEQPHTFPWVRLVRDSVAVFGVDSTHGRRRSLFTHALGNIGIEQLGELGKLLHDYSEVPVKVILIHHCPDIPKGRLDTDPSDRAKRFCKRRTHRLKRADVAGLLVLARTFNVTAILHGHTHDGFDRLVEGVRIIGCPASTEVKRGQMSYRIHRTSSPHWLLETELRSIRAL